MKKTEKNSESQLLDLLKRVLPKATHDADLAGKIYKAIEDELKNRHRGVAFDQFCKRMPLASLEPKALDEVKTQLAQAFTDADVTLKPNRKEKTLAIELSLPDGTQLSSQVKVNENPVEVQDEDAEFKPKFVPFPVCLPGDKELVWMLAKHETMSPEEAGIALSKLQEDFWGSKSGQKLLRDRVERSFPEFIGRVPGGMLSEVGLKRHYKTPEPVKILRATKKD